MVNMLFSHRADLLHCTLQLTTAIRALVGYSLIRAPMWTSKHGYVRRVARKSRPLVSKLRQDTNGQTPVIEFGAF